MILVFFEVIRNKEVLIELKLLQSMKIYNIFYLNLLCKASINLFINQEYELPTLVIISNEKK